jgi:hypothetical protein
MDIVYIDKCRYEIQEQKEVPVRYTGIYRPISSTEYKSCLIVCIKISLKRVITDQYIPKLNSWDSSKLFPVFPEKKHADRLT